jgi:hypothetical protein
VCRKAHSLIEIVRTHQHKINSTILQNATQIKEKLLKATRQIKDIITEKRRERWQGKWTQGQFARKLDEKLVDNEQSYR